MLPSIFWECVYRWGQMFFSFFDRGVKNKVSSKIRHHSLQCTCSSGLAVLQSAWWTRAKGQIRQLWSVLMLSFCLLALAAKSNTSCRHGSLAGRLDDCARARARARACMGSWSTFRLPVLLFDYLAATSSLAYVLSGHLCGQPRPLCPTQTFLVRILKHTLTLTLTHRRGHSYHCDLPCLFRFWPPFICLPPSILPSFLPLACDLKLEMEEVQPV